MPEDCVKKSRRRSFWRNLRSGWRRGWPGEAATWRPWAARLPVDCAGGQVRHPGGEDVDDASNGCLAVHCRLWPVGLGEVDAHQCPASPEVRRGEVLGLRRRVRRHEIEGDAVDGRNLGPGAIGRRLELCDDGGFADWADDRRGGAAGGGGLQLGQSLGSRRRPRSRSRNASSEARKQKSRRTAVCT